MELEVFLRIYLKRRQRLHVVIVCIEHAIEEIDTALQITCARATIEQRIEDDLVGLRRRLLLGGGVGEFHLDRALVAVRDAGKALDFLSRCGFSFMSDFWLVQIFVAP